MDAYFAAHGGWPAAIGYFLLHAVSLALMVYLWAVTMRRILFTASAMSTQEPELCDVQLETNVLVLVPARNEADVLESCLRSLLALDWPKERLKIAVIDDGSTDGTPGLLKKFARHPNLHALTRPADEAGAGKPSAMNFALEKIRFGEFVYVIDADARAAPDALKILAGYLQETGHAAVQGGMLPESSAGSGAAFYATVESLVHQGLTMTGARNFGATVSLLGSNYLLRRRVLEKFGGFNPEARLEDVDLSLALQNAGEKIGFEPRAKSTVAASKTARDASAQHRAWSRGFWDIAARRLRAAAAKDEPLILKIDRILFSLGYADRVALAAFLVCMAADLAGHRSFSSPIFLAFYLFVPAAQCVLALRKHHRPRSEYRRLLWMPLGFAFDIFTNFGALIDTLHGRPAPWVRTTRQGSPSD